MTNRKHHRVMYLSQVSNCQSSYLFSVGGKKTTARVSFLLRLFLQCRYRDFADDCLGGADNAAARIVTLSRDPLDTADAKTHGATDRTGRRAYEPGGKSPEISARRSSRNR